MNENQKSNIKKILSWSLTVIAMVFMGWYLYQNRDIFSSMEKISILDIALIVLLRPISIAFLLINPSFNPNHWRLKKINQVINGWYQNKKYQPNMRFLNNCV